MKQACSWVSSCIAGTIAVFLYAAGCTDTETNADKADTTAETGSHAAGAVSKGPRGGPGDSIHAVDVSEEQMQAKQEGNAMDTGNQASGAGREEASTNSRQFADAVELVKEGMSEEQVLAILGEPDSKEPQRWIYRATSAPRAPKAGEHLITGAVIQLRSGKVTEVNLAWIDAGGSGLTR